MDPSPSRIRPSLPGGDPGSVPASRAGSPSAPLPCSPCIPIPRYPGCEQGFVPFSKPLMSPRAGHLLVRRCFQMDIQCYPGSARSQGPENPRQKAGCKSSPGTCQGQGRAWGWRDLMPQFLRSQPLLSPSGAEDVLPWQPAGMQEQSTGMQEQSTHAAHTDAGIAPTDAGTAHMDAGASHVDAGAAHTCGSQAPVFLGRSSFQPAQAPDYIPQNS